MYRVSSTLHHKDVDDRDDEDDDDAKEHQISWLARYTYFTFSVCMNSQWKAQFSWHMNA